MKVVLAMRVRGLLIRYGLIGAITLSLVAACNSSTETTPTATAPVLIRRLATIGPTRTPDATEWQATQLAIYATPTYLPPTLTPTATPYIGAFLGEVEIGDNWGSAINPLDVVVLPTRAAPQGIPMICSQQPDTIAFGTAWMEESYTAGELRCPIQTSYSFNGRAQVFEHGVMYHNPDTGEVWAIFPETPSENGRYWYVDHFPSMSTQGIEIPPGLYVPTGALGAVWASDPDLREVLGYAITREQSALIHAQRFEGGTLLLDAAAGQVFVLLVTGEARGAYNVD